MKHRLVIGVGLVLAGMVSATACIAGAGQPGAACRAHAASALAAFTHGKYAQTVAHFAPSIAGAATPEQMASAWTGLVAQFGAFQKAGPLAPHRVKGRDVLVAELTFAKGKLDAVVACNDSDQLTGFQFVPPSLLASMEGSAKGAKATPMAQLQALTAEHEHKPHEKIKARVLPDGVRVEPLAVASPYGPLPGALTLPSGKGPFPAVVLVQGSGQSDMDETIGTNKPFRDIAVGLARAGIASLRYDKRGFVYPAKAAQNQHFTVDDEVTDDAVTALRLLARQTSVDAHRVYVLGHSEGAMLVPRIVKRDRQVAGGVMLAAPARPLLTVMIDQTRELGPKRGVPEVQIKASVQALEDEQALLEKATHPPTGTFGNLPQSWLWSMHTYHQVKVARSLTRPLLIVQGGADFQVSPTQDFEAWKHALGARDNVTFHLFPGLSHLFRKAGPTRTVADYLEAGATDGAVIDVIGQWIKAQAARPL